MLGVKIIHVGHLVPISLSSSQEKIKRELECRQFVPGVLSPLPTGSETNHHRGSSNGRSNVPPRGSFVL